MNNEVLNLIDKHRYHFKKKFGQNFIIDDNILNKIINIEKINDNDLCLEIGIGSGILTKKLASVSRQVLGYEIDNSLNPLIDEALVNLNNIEIIYEDFLKRDVVSDIKKYEYSNLYIIANLPYYITTPIITKIIEDKLPVNSIIVMMQKEVAERISAKPGSKQYNSLTIFINYYFDVSREFEVSRNVFVPKPNVDSMVIRMKRKNNKYNVKNEQLFFKLVRDSFVFKRKNLRNNLKSYDLDLILSILQKYGLDLNVRAEQIPIEIFIDISNNF